MKMASSRIGLLIFLGLSVLLFSFSGAFQEKKPWNVPDNAKKMKNAVKSDAESIAAGKALYAKHCKSCHGKGGEGDGTHAGNSKGERQVLQDAGPPRYSESGWQGSRLV